MLKYPVKFFSKIKLIYFWILLILLITKITHFRSDLSDVPVKTAALEVTSAMNCVQILVSDTVGFIQKLPTQLVAAFRATLEEIQQADVLLHVVDASHPDAAKQCETVLKVLEEIGISDETPMVTVRADNSVQYVCFWHGAEQLTANLAVMYGYHVDRAIPDIAEAVYSSKPSLFYLVPSN